MAMPVAAAEALVKEIPLALQQAVSLRDPVRIVTRSVTIFESITDAGERTMSYFPSEDMQAWDMLGFLEYVKECAGRYVETGN